MVTSNHFGAKLFVIFMLVIPLMAIAITAFVGTIAFAVVGVIVATEENICSTGNISIGCTPAADISFPAVTNISTLLGMNVQSIIFDGRDDDQAFLYWLAGATGCGLLFAFVGAFCIWAAANIIHFILHPIKPELIELLELPSQRDGEPTSEPTSEGTLSPREEQTVTHLQSNTKILMKIERKVTSNKKSPHKEIWMDRIGDGEYEVRDEHDHDELHFNSLGCGSLVGLFLCFLCGALSILCLMWSFAIGFNRTNRAERTVIPFVLANLLSGIVAPVLFFISAFTMVNIFDYYTDHKAESHTILPRFLSCLKYEEGEKEKNYWIIADALLFELSAKGKKGDIQNAKCRFFAQCAPTYSTFTLCIIICICLMLSFSYFVDISLISQVSVDSCNDTSIDIHYSCFRAGTLGHVDCTSNTRRQVLHCFKFYRFGIDVDLVTSLVSAFAFFLLTNRIFTGIFVMLKMFRHYFKRTQGVVFICGGLLLLLMNLILFIVWLAGYASTSMTLLSHLDILNLAQLTMVSLFVLLVGLLARKGKWIEIKPTTTKIVHFKQLQPMP